MKRGIRIMRKLSAVVACLAVVLSLVVAAPLEALADQYVMLDLVVYYNDSSASYFEHVKGGQVMVTGPGTYTVKFDCAENLAYEQTSAGITGLNNIGAIYLIDDKRFSNVTRDSIVKSFDFKYDSIKLDGKELELINHDEMSGLKDQGQIDTNGPVNAWENCQLASDAYTVADYVLNFTGFENPQVIEITFTVTNMEFKEAETKEETTEETQTEEASSEETTIESTESEETASIESSTQTAETEKETAQESTKEETKSSNGAVKIALVVVLAAILVVVLIVVLKKLKK